MKEYQFTVVFEKLNHRWLAHVPVLNGITTEGDSLEHAKEMAREAILGYIACLRADNLPIPEEYEREPIVEKMIVAA